MKVKIIRKNGFLYKGEIKPVDAIIELDDVVAKRFIELGYVKPVDSVGSAEAEAAAKEAAAEAAALAEEETSIRAEAKELGIANWHTTKLDKLKVKIAESKASANV